MDKQDERTTRLYFEAPVFGEVAEDIYKQGQLFRLQPDAEDTGFDLLGAMLIDIESRTENSDRFDTPLLKRLAKLNKPIFQHGVESVSVVGHRLTTDNPPTIDPKVVTIAASLQQETPVPRRARVQGKLDMIRMSDQSFELLLKNGDCVRAIWAGENMTSLGQRLNQSVLIEGNAVFRPSGSLLRIDTDVITSATTADEFFSKLPQPTHQRSVRGRYVKGQTPTTGIGAIFGKWPGDESEEELLAALKELD